MLEGSYKVEKFYELVTKTFPKLETNSEDFLYVMIEEFRGEDAGRRASKIRGLEKEGLKYEVPCFAPPNDFFYAIRTYLEMLEVDQKDIDEAFENWAEWSLRYSS